MSVVVYYSNTGQSLAVGRFFAEKLCCPLIDIAQADSPHYDDLVLVFPVHSQNIPRAVKVFLKAVNVKNLTVIATYGKMCCGNVLYEIQRKYRKNIVAGAYVPTKHSYIKDDCGFTDFELLTPVVEKINTPSAIELPKLYKNPLSNLFPRLRSRLGVKLDKSDDCDGCGICTKVCPVGAIKNGVIDGKCIRCLRCVSECPKKALNYKCGIAMSFYLRKTRSDKTIVYV